jgi:hypothetical protein
MPISKAMEKLQFIIPINASKDCVWKALWSDETYRQWTSVFHKNSYVQGEWKEGSKIYFLTEPGRGIFSIVKKKTDNEQMIFEHLGVVKDGIEEPKDWIGSHECYYLSEDNGKTILKIEMDTTRDFKQYFSDTFPIAMDTIKNIAEMQAVS